MLENWLRKVSPSLTTELSTLSPESIGRSIKIHKDLFPQLDDCQIVILSDDSENMDFIRTQFYEMYHHFDNLFFADLGEIRNSDTNFLINLFNELLESKLTPIIVSNNQELIHTFHFALNSFHNSFSSLFCGKVNAPYSANDYANCRSVHSLGVQGHFVPSSIINHKHIVRLGDIKDCIEEAEPITRNVDTIQFDLSVLKQSEAPGQQNTSPCGLNAEDYTQLFRFFGYNDVLKAIFITGYESSYDFNRVSAQLIAQGLWYFIDARDNCFKENIDSNEAFHEFVVDIEGLDEPLSFIKAKKSGRWWIKSHDDEKVLIPCSFKDYEMACNNEIPNRLFETL